MAIKSEEAVSGCWAAAKDDEPLFVLKSTDELAPAIVRAWCHAYFEKHCRRGYSGPGSVLWDSEKSKAKYEKVWRLANEMEAYRRGQNGGT